ncbi:P27 family phage terminase small subunit [Treponema pectinovorum]|uniref:P27 family phage terminase small subunit n=1 Tax=Treponema pectinovorum TaxID=164 RepID=UPI0011CCAF04|nr:P27 family phage terminase small subunit [Treponema pectinovorum]
MARPKKSVELKILEGTYRADRDSTAKVISDTIKKTEIILDKKNIPCPKTIQDEYVKKYWKKLTRSLLSIHVLSGADIPQLEMLCIILQRIRKIQEELESIDYKESEDIETLEKRYLRFVAKFDSLGAKYYISPQARSKLTLDDLAIVKTAQDIQKKQDGISNILAMRK